MKATPREGERVGLPQQQLAKCTCKLVSIDALPSCTVVVGKITSLAHKPEQIHICVVEDKECNEILSFSK